MSIKKSKYYGNASELLDKNKEYADKTLGGLSTDKKYDIAAKLAMAAGSGEQTGTSGAITGGATGFMIGNAVAPGIGGAVGAGIGGVFGLLSGKSAEKHREEQTKYNNNRRAMEDLIGITKAMRL